MSSGFNYRRLEGIEDLPPAYAKLFADAEAQSYYFGLDWLRLLAKYGLDSNERIFVHALENAEGTPVLALPVRVSRANSSERQHESLANYYTSLFSPIYSQFDDIARQAFSTLPAVLRQASDFDSINLRSMAHDSEEFKTLFKAFGASGWIAQEYFCFGNWYLEVNGRSFAEYCESLPSVARNTIKRKSKKFEAAKGTLEIVTSCENLEKYIDDYTKIYNSSWKTEEPFPHFVPELIRLSARRGWLRLGMAYVDGEPAAAQIWITQNGTANIYKLAYDEKFQQLSAGTVLTSLLFQQALDTDKVHTVDYLTGDDAYKRDWMSHRRERWGILAFNARHARGLVGAMVHVLPHHIKRLWNRQPKDQTQAGHGRD
jgi:Acetyltransferase (GNAT) domain